MMNLDELSREELISRILELEKKSERQFSKDEIKLKLDGIELLLRDLQHRVKNNFQTIMSLLNLQSGYISDSETKEIIKTIQNRIKVVALVHEQLHKTKNYTHISTAKYLNDIIRNIASSFNGSSIIWRLALEDHQLEIDKAVSLGLIVNELVTNSVKYAFRSSDTKSQISVSVARSENNYSLSIKDNGVGLPDDLDPQEASTLGFNLIYNLADQLKGTVKIEETQGTAFLIVFP